MKRYLKLLAMMVSVSAVISATGCAKPKLVESVEVKTSTSSEGDAIGEVKATVNTGFIKLPNLSLPISDPRNPNEVYGQFTVKSTDKGKSNIDILINLSDIAHVPGLAGRLPNNSRLPVGGIDQSNIISLPIPPVMARVYVGFDSDNALIGVAVPIKEMDIIGAIVGQLDLFFSFLFRDMVQGSFGAFAGSAPGQNGFALFVDVSLFAPTLDASKNSSQLVSSGLSKSSAGLLATRAPASYTPVKLGNRIGKKIQFGDVSTSSLKAGIMQSMIYDMNSKQTRFHLN